ncbi:MAG TPA: sigma-54 dependent transcriptional regulator [Candidatus Krumholzibacteriaceae bacterium]|nr:sigma-54 dependent transcriptional regulator [Candidatus Krumholzibacteriaceae bacterium]
MKPVVLLVDDENTIRMFLEKTLKDDGYETFSAANGTDALQIVEKELPDLVILDLKLPDINGMEVLEKIKKDYPEITIIMLTAFGDIKTAVSAMRRGAFDFITKPVNLEQLLFVVEKGLDSQRINRELINLRRRVDLDFGKNYVPSTSDKMNKIYKTVKTVAGSGTTTVLIQGESGTGKEIIANMIHNFSKRRDKAFMEVNCASLPEELLESELFGHERGAFTDAKERKRGLLELTNNGTLFLDEIGEMSKTIQVKFLRVLEKMTFRRVGGTKDLSVDVRIISATNRDLEEAVEKNEFRKDLYYRLKVVPINIPPLRERKEDLYNFIKHFLNRFNKQFNKNFKDISDEAFEAIIQYKWPGNIRELKNAVERIVLLEDDEVLKIEHLPSNITDNIARIDGKNKILHKIETALSKPFTEEGVPFEDLIKSLERDLIRKAMEESDNNQSRASKLLRLNRDKLRYRLKNLDFTQ